MPRSPVFAKGEPRSGIIAVGLSNGHALVAKHEYNLSYPNDQRKIVPVVSYPLGETPIALNPTGQPILSLAVQEGSSGTANYRVYRGWPFIVKSV